MKKINLKTVLIGAVLVVAALMLTACASATPAPTQAPVATAVAPTCPEPTACPAGGVAEATVPNFDLWSASPHADAKAEAFNHWNEADPKEIPTSCAKCHSQGGFQDYVGADGSEAFKVDKAAAIGSVISCDTCHNSGTAALTTVKFPSGAEVTGLGREAVCMTCHQGTAAGSSVDAAIEKAGATDLDVPVKDLGFTNLHYFAASVARYGTDVKGGYQYEGKSYDALWQHVQGVNTCTDCHNPHSLELQVDKCSTCHQGVTKAEDLRNVRMASSQVDYDGDGDVKEGIYYEVDGLRTMLYTAIQTYSKDVAGTAIVYSPTVYPYFFVDTNADGKTDEAEAAFANAYASWTPRMAKAAFNYQLSIKDPGSYAHGGKYIIELLYDSIENLNEKLKTPVDLSKAHRIDPGHFAGSEMAFRDWDADGAVPATCSKCHSATGLPQFLKEGVNISNPISDGLMCETCHSDLTTFARYQVETVKFPSGASLGFEGKPDANLCINCHQGRESTVSVNKVVAGQDRDKINEKLTFRNVHYFAAGATLFGTDAKGMYEYDGKEYAGQFKHVDGYNTCVDCHDTHALNAKVDACAGCHNGQKPEEIRMTTQGDFDGDGNDTEGLAGEIETLQEKMLAAIQAYAKDVVKTPIVYSPAAYPYWFIDTNANGQLDAEEAVSDNSYKALWTPRLLEAAYNYQYVVKDPGAFVHNGKYVIQVMFDTLADLKAKVPSIDTAGLVRPK
ncbi:MAG TPA: cytochrome c3 family protein [Longilinea sp.]|nr:cytochrome c3 family protein [Longilinea sp.]